MDLVLFHCCQAMHVQHISFYMWNHISHIFLLAPLNDFITCYNLEILAWYPRNGLFLNLLENKNKKETILLSDASNRPHQPHLQPASQPLVVGK